MNSQDKQLLVEAALAAANHGLREQAHTLLHYLPTLIADETDRALYSAMIHFGLDEQREALFCLNGLQDPRAEGLKAMFSLSSGKNADEITRICQLLAGEKDED
jgi:type III secretion system SsaH family protein